MRQNTFLPIAFIALNAGTDEQELTILKEHGFQANKPMKGVYKGKEENSWLICITGQEQRRKLVDLAREYKQESILFSGIDRTCTLHYIEDGREEILGVLTETPEHHAKQQQSYTFDPQSGKYWVVL